MLTECYRRGDGDSEVSIISIQSDQGSECIVRQRPHPSLMSRKDLGDEIGRDSSKDVAGWCRNWALRTVDN